MTKSRFIEAQITGMLKKEEAIAVGAGGRFPTALVALRPYIVPYARELAHLASVKQSQAPEVLRTSYSISCGGPSAEQAPQATPSGGSGPTDQGTTTA